VKWQTSIQVANMFQAQPRHAEFKIGLVGINTWAFAESSASVTLTDRDERVVRSSANELTPPPAVAGANRLQNCFPFYTLG
jgi:hypothetical protein